MVRGDMLRLVRPLVPHRFDRRSAKIGDRVGDVLVDRRNAILRRAYPGVIFLAAIAPFLALWNSIVALISRKIRWRGIRYELLSPGQTNVLSR